MSQQSGSTCQRKQLLNSFVIIPGCVLHQQASFRLTCINFVVHLLLLPVSQVNGFFRNNLKKKKVKRERKRERDEVKYEKLYLRKVMG